VVARRTIDKVDRSEGGAICLDVRFSPCHKALTEQKMRTRSSLTNIAIK
jgi:hypothetical protein